MFSPSPHDLPSVDQLKVGQVFFIRETPLKKYKGKFELIAGSYDKHWVWAFFDAELKEFVSHPNRPSDSKDLDDQTKLDPAFKEYARKLMRWSEIAPPLSDAAAIKKKGRPTLRIEEIKDEKQFFDCVVQVSPRVFSTWFDRTDVRRHRDLFQVIKSGVRPGEQAQTVYVTDWTSNPFLESAEMKYDREPTEPFGHHTLTISLW